MPSVAPFVATKLRQVIYAAEQHGTTLARRANVAMEAGSWSTYGVLAADRANMSKVALTLRRSLRNIEVLGPVHGAAAENTAMERFLTTLKGSDTLKGAMTRAKGAPLTGPALATPTLWQRICSSLKFW